MSSIASLWVLDRDALTYVVAAARAEGASGVRESLTQHGRDVDDEFNWSGYVMLYLLVHLDQRGIALMESELQSDADAINSVYDATFVITPAHKRYVAQLDPARHDEAELAAFFDEMGYGFDEVGMATHDGLTLLREQIGALAADEVLLVHIG